MFDDIKRDVDRSLDRFRDAKTIRKRVANAMDEVATELLVPGAKERAPRDTGRLERSIQFFGGEWEGDRYVVEFGTDIPYAKYVEYETKAHPITPSTQPYLHFYWDNEGKWMKTPAVMHPGTDAEHFIKDTLEDEKVQKRIEQASSQAFEGWARGRP